MQIANLLSVLLDVYMLVLLARVILSWTSMDRRNPIAGFIEGATEPVLAPIRSLIGIRAGMDLSPLVAMILLSLARRFLMRLL